MKSDQFIKSVAARMTQLLPADYGFVEVRPTNNVYTNGDGATLTAVPATNYVFRGWGGDA